MKRLTYTHILRIHNFVILILQVMLASAEEKRAQADKMAEQASWLSWCG